MEQIKKVDLKKKTEKDGKEENTFYQSEGMLNIPCAAQPLSQPNAAIFRQQYFGSK